MNLLRLGHHGADQKSSERNGKTERARQDRYPEAESENGDDEHFMCRGLRDRLKNAWNHQQTHDRRHDDEERHPA